MAERDKERKLNPYSVYDVYPEEGACLVFHYTAKEAKKLGYETLRSWFDTEFIDVRVKKLPERFDLLDQMTEDSPHVIDCPRVCLNCERWGHPFFNREDKYCIYCLKEFPELKEGI